jgi:DNA (cytosine-5)-methyltransferase 1
MPRKPSDLTVTDLFCGAGGSSLGAARAGGRLRMALNHWDLAIETHNTNFPEADHDCTDASACDPRRYPSTQVLIASPECTSHSLAKGRKRRGAGQSDLFTPASQDPADIRSRATMWDVPRFAEAHRYELVIVENVVDAKYWDPFPAWIQAMHCLGYEHREVYLNSMFAHPTPQSRDRLYVVFWRKGNRAPDLEIRPRSWCSRCERDVEAVQSWKPRRSWGRYRRQYVYCCPGCSVEVQPYYFAALNAIDWSVPATRIRDRKRPLKERTLERARYGLAKYGSQPLVVRTNMTSGVECRVRAAAGDPLDTQPGSNITALVSPLLIQTRHIYGVGYRVRSAASDPMPTQTADLDNAALFPPTFVLTYRNYEGAGYPVSSVTDPLRTIVGSAQERLVINGAALLSLRDWRGGPLVRHLGEPLPTQIANGPQEAVVSHTPFLATYMGQSEAHPIDGPIPTITTRDREALVTPEGAAEVEDCFFRMLEPHEVGAGMAFPSDYTVLGNKRDRVKMYGNAVTPPAMEELMRRAIASLEGGRAA